MKGVEKENKSSNVPINASRHTKVCKMSREWSRVHWHESGYPSALNCWPSPQASLRRGKECNIMRSSALETVSSGPTMRIPEGRLLQRLKARDTDFCRCNRSLGVGYRPSDSEHIRDYCIPVLVFSIGQCPHVIHPEATIWPPWLCQILHFLWGQECSSEKESLNNNRACLLETPTLSSFCHPSDF